MPEINSTQQYMDVLSRTLVRLYCVESADEGLHSRSLAQDFAYLARLEPHQWQEFIDLANSNHVLMRFLTALRSMVGTSGRPALKEACEAPLAAERARIEHATECLQEICNTLEASGSAVAVIKSLDHWPDLGSDLDLYTLGDSARVQEVMLKKFQARPVARSWGDRLANKWNFRVPGLPELVEIHVQFLGQTGEHAKLAMRVIERRMVKALGERQFYVPAPEQRLVISTLQRVYRHFYFRLCDIVDVARLLRTETVDFDELKKSSELAGIWPGVATFLALIRDYIEAYGGSMVLPADVLARAETVAGGLQLKGQFLRMSKLSATGLYGVQCLAAARRRDLRALVRLPLLPPLAISALVAYRLTGNDKGIW